jgi:hypothetical protein
MPSEFFFLLPPRDNDIKIIRPAADGGGDAIGDGGIGYTLHCAGNYLLL